MHPEQDDFESVRCLLALKRHEVPPPGFFDAFPDAVRARIRAGRTRPVIPWWQRLFRPAQWRPALAGACAVAVGGVVVWHAGFGQTARLPMYPSLARGEQASAPNHLTPLHAMSSVTGLGDAELASSVANSSMRPVVGAPPPSWLFTPGAGMRGVTRPAAAYVRPTAMVVTGLQSSASAPSTSTNLP